MPACPHLHSGNGAATTSESGYCEFVCSELGTVPGPEQVLQNISSDGHLLSVCHLPTSVPGTGHPVVLVTDTTLPSRGPCSSERVRLLTGDIKGYLCMTDSNSTYNSTNDPVSFPFMAE